MYGREQAGLKQDSDSAKALQNKPFNSLNNASASSAVMRHQQSMGNQMFMRMLNGNGSADNGMINGTEMLGGSDTAEVAGKKTGNRNNTGIPDRMKSRIESLSGIAMDDIRVHYNSDKPEPMGALAYTEGTNIFVAPSQESSLAHEAWHVVQQKRGGVQATQQMRGQRVNDDLGLEHEADVMGARAAATTVAANSAPLQSLTVETPVIQGSFLTMLTSIPGINRLYHHFRRENTYNDILGEQAQYDAKIPAGVEHRDDMGDNETSFAMAINQNPQAMRQYQVQINNRNPLGFDRTDPHLIRAAEIHEKTHVAADQAYSANAGRSDLQLHNNGEDGFEQLVQRNNRSMRMLDIVENDRSLTDQQRVEMLKRLEYSGKDIEYDPVINELLTYTREYGIKGNSSSVKALVELARENLARRRPGAAPLQGDWPAGQ